MAQENVEVVRHPLTLAAHSSRRIEERLALRLPYIQSLVARVWSKRPLHSRLRQAILPRLVRSGFEAANRGDFAVAFANYDPDIQFFPPTGLVGLGDEPSYRGLEARVRYQGQWRAEWGDFRYEPDELRDLGDRLLVIGRIKSGGLSSGAKLDSDYANLFTLSAGRVIREQTYFNRAEGLEAVGLQE
ncbi:MAG TPA: nuclear transport factor 2 family protein [Thermoleophilaceae bacterium]|jgi:ketosteroid isomerase-like protein